MRSQLRSMFAWLKEPENKVVFAVVLGFGIGMLMLTVAGVLLDPDANPFWQQFSLSGPVSYSLKMTDELLKGAAVEMYGAAATFVLIALVYDKYRKSLDRHQQNADLRSLNEKLAQIEAKLDSLTASTSPSSQAVIDQQVES